MLRSMIFSVAAGMAALLAFAPLEAAAQPGRYLPPPSQYQPYQQAPAVADLGGTWYMSGDLDQPCQVQLSRTGDRAMFINENGDRAAGTIRGNRITVPSWHLGAIIDRDGDKIFWDNRSVWTR